MSRLRTTLLAAAAALCLASSARAYTYGDTLTLIQKPLPNIPAFARPGDDLTIWATAPSAVTGWTASLGLGGGTIALTPVTTTWEPTLGRWVLVFQVPSGVDEELYDLNVACGTCTPDVARHAVKVLPAFKSSFYFAQISDTHLPEHTFSSNGQINTADTTGMADFDAVIDDLNLIHPEFILHTGDLVNEGELEEYLGMYEMGRAQGMITRLRDPMFVVTGNHDIGGWKPTAPPDGTSRKAWWRTFGWKWLENPPVGEPHHSQDYSFDYGLLHCIGLEAYINNGSYDSYRTDLWGAQSFTPEQMNWLQADIAAVPAGHSKLAFYHYDFGGTNGDGSPGANFSQINPAALGLNGVIWGHNHVVAEGNRTAQPFNLGLQSVIDRRVFRIFRVVNGVISPGPMHRSGQTPAADSLTTAWSAPNDGSRARNTATVTNRFGEAFEHARLVFNLADHDSICGATGGTVVETRWQNGVEIVYVDALLPASGTAVVSVFPVSPADVSHAPKTFRLESPKPNPFSPARGALDLRFSLRTPGPARLALYDLEGRHVATLLDREAGLGTQTVSWNGTNTEGEAVRPGVYLLRLDSPDGTKKRKISVVR